ncbi:pyridoxal phosphate-dependent aminotransferase family protein [Staphylococcus ursi]|nr:pyridoxal phosphate-dependent aminotransferase family protein [Staphylococcus sp. MI 10-1553]
MDLQRKLETIQAKGQLRQLREVEAVDGKWMTMQGRQFLNFTSNDYLGLGQMTHAEVVSEQAQKHLASSRLVSGNSALYTKIERLLSTHFHFEDALVTTSGYDANLAVMQAFQGEGVIVFSDAANHASIIDGIRLSRLKKVIYPHNDITALEKVLFQYPEMMTKVVVTDSVFSTYGDFANLDALVQLKAKIPNMWLIVDDAHAFGLHLHTYYSNIDILTTSLSKGVGAHGGAILCSSLFKQVLINVARPVIYSNALPQLQLAQLYENLKIMLAQPEKAQVLHQLSDTFNQLYHRDFGVPYEGPSTTPIKWLSFDDAHEIERVYQALLAQGIWVSYFRYPTVARPILRVSLSLFHEVHDLEYLFEQLSCARRKEVR